MLITPFVSIIAALISPWIWASLNITEKYAMRKYIKAPLSFAILAGIVLGVISFIIALFLDWSTTSVAQLSFPIIAGSIFGFQFYLYYYLISQEDASSVIGFIYFYPLLVAVLSFIFLGERLHLISYGGMFLIIIGVLLLAKKAKITQTKKGTLCIISLIVIVAIYEFLVKISTINMPVLHAITASNMALGSTIALGLLVPSLRRGAMQELRNFRWIIINELITLAAISSVFIGMVNLPASIVSSIGATQSLAVVGLEVLLHRMGIPLSDGLHVQRKLLTILCIVGGVILLYLPEIF